MRPPISSERRLLIARPRPVPPYLRVVDESACENDWNRRLIASADEADARVAHGERELDLARGDRPRAHRQHDLAVLGELHRVGQQIQHDLAQARHVADDRAAARRPRTRRPCRGASPSARALTRSSADSTHSRRSNGCASMSMRPGLDLREVEDVVDDGQERVARFADRRDIVVLLGIELGVEQQPAHADHRVHRRADLVAHRREERALRLVGRLGRGARLLRLVNSRTFWIAITAWSAKVCSTKGTFFGISPGVSHSDVDRADRLPVPQQRHAEDAKVMPEGKGLDRMSASAFRFSMPTGRRSRMARPAIDPRVGDEGKRRGQYRLWCSSSQPIAAQVT